MFYDTDYHECVLDYLTGAIITAEEEEERENLWFIDNKFDNNYDEKNTV